MCISLASDYFDKCKDNIPRFLAFQFSKATPHVPAFWQITYLYKAKLLPKKVAHICTKDFYPRSIIHEYMNYLFVKQTNAVESTNRVWEYVKVFKVEVTISFFARFAPMYNW